MKRKWKGVGGLANEVVCVRERERVGGVVGEGMRERGERKEKKRKKRKKII